MATVVTGVIASHLGSLRSAAIARKRDSFAERLITDARSHLTLPPLKIKIDLSKSHLRTAVKRLVRRFRGFADEMFSVLVGHSIDVSYGDRLPCTDTGSLSSVVVNGTPSLMVGWLTRRTMPLLWSGGCSHRTRHAEGRVSESQSCDAGGFPHQSCRWESGPLDRSKQGL